MGRILAIDYGKKRVGIAVTDPGRIIATGLQTVLSHEVLKFLQEYIAREKVDLFVVGYPKQMDNTDSESMTYIIPFLKALQRKFPDIPVEMYDERFTSVMAHKALIEGGAKKKIRQDKALIDKMSATIILTSYMEAQRRGNTEN
ncbi:Holliday junction resolvase RuvX [uncultured Odoribacter sp.]|uniref:Holliday junction resolvase RuvX n=1 Tax=uncultured Odoribacter sp. TaxID=876416 RepID=UPI0026085021|nr:Holliday junction resolvase RuvX [uncultured Odoribacter sp.]